ncbi:MAG: alpha/beta hydrolase [Aureispira sp.]
MKLYSNLLITAFSFLPLFLLAQKKYFSFDEIHQKNVPANYQYETKRFNSFDNVQIAYYVFNPKEEAIASLVFIHGGGANSKLGYLELAQTLSEKHQIKTILMDLRGHGESAGRRGDAPSIYHVYRDISELLDLTKEKDKPLYLGGHSSGGGTILNYSTQEGLTDVDGYIFVSPYLGDNAETAREDAVTFFELDISKFISNAQSDGLENLNDYAVFFNYPKEVLKASPSIVTALTVCMSNATTPYKAKEDFAKITKPYGLFIGQDDELFDSKKVIAFDQLPTERHPKSTAKVIKNEKHLSILNGIGTEIGETITTWQLP